MSAKGTKELLDYIIKQEKDLVDYPDFKKTLPEIFEIGKRGEGLGDYTSELVDAIIDWEKGNQYSSLEETINRNFVVFKKLNV